MLDSQHVPASMAPAEFDLHYTEYGASVAAAGGLPVELNRDADVPDLISRLDALVLTGGADIDPDRYGATPSPDLGSTEPDRDGWELALFAAARAARVPVLGICRGLQLVNVACGGTLVQHVGLDDGVGHPHFDDDRWMRVHKVSIEPGSRAAAIYGSEVAVNSLHHQIVDRIGDGLTATAWADDGAVETLELPGHDVLAVQWHPEMLRPGPDPSFSWLIDAGRRYATARAAARR